MNFRDRPQAGPRIELGTERESLLQVLDEDADFGRKPAAGRSNRTLTSVFLYGMDAIRRNNDSPGSFSSVRIDIRV
jgi:hypothetical protein